MNRNKTRFALVRFAVLALAVVLPFLSRAQGWPANYGGVMLQGFYWDSYSDTKWSNLTSQADELSTYFDVIWVPNSATTGGGATAKQMGYAPCYWLQHNTIFGTETELKNMISTYKAKGVTIMEDLVVNHKSGRTSWCDFPNETRGNYSISWNNSTRAEICNTDECNRNGFKTTGAADTGDDFDGSRDLDHTSVTVQNNIKQYVKFLTEELGYGGFRLDMVKGYSASYAGTYLRHAGAKFNVGEYWDGDYNKVVAWINGTGKTAAAFDYPLKYRLNEAYGNGNWSALSDKGIAGDPNMSQWAVTFVDNHDTGQSGNSSNLGNTSNILAANAFILAMPGTPCIFLEHWKKYKEEIGKMILARKAAGITNTSPIVQQGEQGGGYVTVVQGTKGRVMVVSGYVADLNDIGWTPVSVGNSTNQNYAFYVNSELGGIPDGGGSTTTTIPSCATFVSGKTFAYFEAPSSWGDVKAWAWNDGGNLTGDDWPGNGTMTKVGNADNGNAVYLWTADASVLPTSILFNANNGADQTGDFTFTNGGYYAQSGLVGTVTGSGTGGGTVEDGQVTIYVNSKANIYAWAGEGDSFQELTAAWPGDALTQTKTINGKTWYYKTFNKKPINVVLNSGLDKAQSTDLTNISSDAYFEYDLSTGTTNDVTSTMGGGSSSSDLPSCATYVDGKTFAYFEAPSTWATDVKAWAWNENGNVSTTGWPGNLTMTKVGTNGSNPVYQWTADKSVVPTGILFLCNSGSTQSPDFTFTNGGYYTMDGLKGVVTSGGGGGSTVEDGQVTIYVNSKANIYAWAGEGDSFQELTAAWPGDALTQTKTINGKTWYYKTFNKKPINVVLNSGLDAAQSTDLTNISSDAYFEYDLSTGATNDVTSTIGGGGDETGNKIAIYVKTTAGANIYAWTGEGDAFRELTATWPGDALAATKTLNGTTWYVKEFTADVVNLVLNSGLDAVQSANLEGITKDTFIEYNFETGAAKVVDGTNSGDTPDGSVTVYVSTSDTATNIYAWDADGELTATWPGDRLTATKTVDGKTWYYKTFNKATVNVVINNNDGATQSADFENLTKDTYIVYNPATGEGTDVTSEIGGGGSGSEVNDGNVTVYVKTNDANPHIYAWVGEGTSFAEMTATWPGDELTQTKVVDGATWYYKTFNKNPLNIVLNCGTDDTKTADINGITKDIYLEYDASLNKATDVTDNVNKGGDNKDGIIPSCATYVDGKTFAYFEAPATWTAPVRVWAWTIYDNFNGEWPGTSMTKVGNAANGNAVYQWIYNGDFSFLPEQILFNSTNANDETEQSDDFVFTNGGYYTMSGLLGVVQPSTKVKGDVNNDGEVNGADITALYERILNNVNPAGDPDVTGDGNVNGADVTALYELLLK